MSGLEVLGGISAIIAIIDGSIKVFDSTRKDIMLPETFKTVRNRLPIIANILQTCKDDLEPIRDSLPANICEALEISITACEKKAAKLREIFNTTVMKESDKWSTRQIHILRRLGKGSKVDELMMSITQDVQLIVNNHMLRSFRWQSISTYDSTFGKPQGKGNIGSRKDCGLCLGKAPYLSPDRFIGRGQELDAIDRVLNRHGQHRKQRRLIITGIGGIGKTQLAIAYSERRVNLYESVFWLNAASEAMIKESFRSIAGLILSDKMPGLLEEEAVLTLVHRWLSDTENARWLLIFDNYDEPDQFDIEKYYPPISHGVIIVATRRPDIVSGEMIRVQPIKEIDDSLAILQTRSQRENVHYDAHAKHLAARLAGLPLAWLRPVHISSEVPSHSKDIFENTKHVGILTRRIRLGSKTTNSEPFLLLGIYLTLAWKGMISTRRKFSKCWRISIIRIFGTNFSAVGLKRALQSGYVRLLVAISPLTGS